jgi:integrase
VKRLKTDGGGHSPWPESSYQYVVENAPPYIQRMAYLGRACGQRISDLVRMRAADLVADGIALYIGKLRERSHIVPLTGEQMDVIRSWGVRDLDCLITTPLGKRFRAGYLRELWNRWSDQFDQTRDLSVHGLRATAINDRRLAGATDGGIADELCMSVKMVSRYFRFADKVAAARASRDRRKQKVTGFVKNTSTL